MDDQLKWSHQIKHCQAKLSSSLYAIRSARHILSGNHLSILYNSLIQPYLDYGTLLWGASGKSIIKPLQMSQKKAIRLVCNANYNSPTKELLRQKNCLSLDDIYNFQICKFMYDYNKGSLPRGLSGIFSYNHDVHAHNTRHRNDPFITSRRSVFASKSLLHLGPKLWHAIPSNIKESNSASHFSKKLKKYYIHKYNIL